MGGRVLQHAVAGVQPRLPGTKPFRVLGHRRERAGLALEALRLAHRRAQARRSGPRPKPCRACARPCRQRARLALSPLHLAHGRLQAALRKRTLIALPARCACSAH